MLADNQHIIQRQTIEISFDRMDNSVGLQNQVTDVFYGQLLPRMEVILDELFGRNQFASIDKLEIDCGSLDVNNWEQEFTTQAIRKLKEELNQANKKEIDVLNIEELTAADTFFFFLENGFLPWNKRIDSISELEQLLKVDEKLVVRLKKLILQNEKVADRLAYQFSDNCNVKIITAFTENSNNDTDSLSAILENIGALQSGTFGHRRLERHLVNATILKMFASGESKNRELQFFMLFRSKIENNAELKSEISEIIKELHIHSDMQIQANKEILPESGHQENQNRASGELSKAKPETSSRKDITKITEATETIYIANAGLVLLHPFLPSLFEQLNLMKEKIWIDKVSQQKAVLVLEFLATGKEKMEEFDLMLNKILCGIAIDEIVPIELNPDDETKSECEDLLQNVITHWSVLKNTSIAGLMEAFLQRSGKLTRVDDGWLMQVEQNAIDILLNQLPWGIGIIKLPWMNEMLYVEWT